MDPREKPCHVQGAMLNEDGDIRSGDRSPVGWASVRDKVLEALPVFRLVPRDSIHPLINLPLDTNGDESSMPFRTVVGSLKVPPNFRGSG